MLFRLVGARHIGEINAIFPWQYGTLSNNVRGNDGRCYRFSIALVLVRKMESRVCRDSVATRPIKIHNTWCWAALVWVQNHGQSMRCVSFPTGNHSFMIMMPRMVGNATNTPIPIHAIARIYRTECIVRYAEGCRCGVITFPAGMCWLYDPLHKRPIWIPFLW